MLVAIGGRKIIKAEKYGKFTDLDVEQATDWVACACGKMYLKRPFKVYRKGIESGPVSRILRGFGEDFAIAVEFDDFMMAGSVLISIEDYQEKKKNEKAKRQD